MPQGSEVTPGAVFDVADFDVRRLVMRKARAQLTVSVCIPALDEEATVGGVVAAVHQDLMQAVPLVDEVLVIDDGSRDATAERARAAGARVVAAADVLPELGPGTGKGEAMWKALHASRGDLVCFVDADLAPFDSRFVVGLLGPLLTRPEVLMVKGYHRRPADGPTGGGRVTELVARPLLGRLFPHLADVVQPLSGEYAARREALEALPFPRGWGVDLALLIDLVDRFGLPALAQVDLGTRHHRHRPLAELSLQAMAILCLALGRAGLDRAAAASPPPLLVRFDPETHERLELPVELEERPPMLEVAAYLAKFGRERSA